MYFVFFLMSMINAICFADNAYPPQKYECEKDIVEQRLDAQNARYKTFVYALNLFCTRGASMIDDCALPHGGKGKLVIAYLVAKGWKILVDEYQVILSRE